PSDRRLVDRPTARRSRCRRPISRAALYRAGVSDVWAFAEDSESVIARQTQTVPLPAARERYRLVRYRGESHCHLAAAPATAPAHRRPSTPALSFLQPFARTVERHEARTNHRRSADRWAGRIPALVDARRPTRRVSRVRPILRPTQLRGRVRVDRGRGDKI